MSKEQESQFDSTEHSLDENNDFYDGFSPLDEPVKERAYTKANINSDNIEAVLEEPSFEAPDFTDFEETKDKEPNTFNPAMENLDKKEQMYATEQMVDTVLDVYDKAHLLANRVTKIKDEKISSAIQDGEIDPDLRVPIDDMGNSLGIMEYVQEYNSQLSDAIKLEPEFVEKVRPAMIRVFQKKGLAMTDEQFLAVAFGTDILTKGVMVFQLVKQNNKLISMWKEQSNYSPPSPPPAKEKRQKSKPQPEPEITDEPEIENAKEKKQSFQEPEEFSAKSMVDDMMGMTENSNFETAKQADNMPQFGNPEILSKLDRLSKNTSSNNVIDVTPIEKSKKAKRGRPKGS